MNYPRVLVISNNSFSLSNSNGRTLGLLFKGWPKDKLAQFCITSDGPDWDICNRYFCVSDRQALKSLLTLTGAKHNDLLEYKTKAPPKTKRIKRTAIKSLIRHCIWCSGIWMKGDFKAWIKAFTPNIVIIQSGDTAFTHDLARKISMHFRAKLVFFNTEGVFFLKENFLYKGFCDRVFFPVYRQLYRHSYRKAMHSASYAFYLNDLIKQDNDSVFNVPGMVIYNTSLIRPSTFFFDSDDPVISYFGNFGFDRSKVLVEVANILESAGIRSIINVYGKGFPEIEERLKGCSGIAFHGFVPYEKILEVISKSDVLLHVESQEAEFSESLRYGFSTKIADCLSSGRPFLLYASPSIACSQYLIKNDCAWFADTPESLISSLHSIVFDESERRRKLHNACIVSENNHSVSKNSRTFQNILVSLA